MSNLASNSTPAKSHAVAIAGNPNSGKTALFNMLTGAHQKIANFPGVTVEKKEGVLKQHATDTTIKIIDLPGTYSLDADTPDELVAQQVLLGLRHDTAMPDLILVVVDATHLERSFFLVSQLMEFGLPLVLSLNMYDVAERQQMRIDLAALSRRLGCPVIPTVAIKSKGKEDLIATLTQQPIKGETGSAGLVKRPFRLSAEIEAQRALIAAELLQQQLVPAAQADFWAGRIMSDRLYLQGELMKRLQPIAQTWREKLHASFPPTTVATAEINARHAWSEELCRDVLLQNSPASNFSDKIDRLTLHPIFGPLIFLLVMTLVFQAVFTGAEPLMTAIEWLVDGMVQLSVALLPASMLRDLWVDGVIAGVGAVIIFIPQILILFFFITVLEDSGYLARAAFLVDRLMVRSGLSGKSFIPLLSSFACAIPGIMATRTIKNERDRLATILVAPLMTCSARLPVYALLIAGFIPATAWFGLRLQGVVLFGLYLLGMLGAVVVAKVLRATVLRGPRSMLILELPDYKMPNWRNIFMSLWIRVKLFLWRAGKIILTISVLLWFLSSFPRQQNLIDEMQAVGASDTAIKAAVMEHSYAGRIGKTLEPLIAPLGYDWKVGVGLIASFAAREVFVATIATLYSVGEADADSGSLRQALQNDRHPSNGAPLFTLPMVLGLLVFFAFAMQCVSTVAVMRRETNGWKWPLVAVAYTYLLAYVAAWMVYRTFSWLIG